MIRIRIYKIVNDNFFQKILTLIYTIYVCRIKLYGIHVYIIYQLNKLCGVHCVGQWCSTHVRDHAFTYVYTVSSSGMDVQRVEICRKSRCAARFVEVVRESVLRFRVLH